MWGFYIYETTLGLISLASFFTHGAKDLRARALQILFCYTFVHELVVHSQISSNNFILYAMYGGVSFGLYLAFIGKSISSEEHANQKKLFYFFSIGSLLCGIVMLFTKLKSFPSEVISIIHGSLIIFTLFFLILESKSKIETITWKNPLFQISALIILYHVAFILYLGILSQLIEKNISISYLSQAHRYVSTLYYILLFWFSLKLFREE